MSKEHVIWSNINLKLEDWEEFIREVCPDASEDEMYGIMEEMNYSYLGDERLNLSDCRTEGNIICIADLGLWNGHKSAFRIIEGNNLSNILEMDNDYQNWYVDVGGDLRSTSIHHDGTNRYLYRELRPELTARQEYNFIQKLNEGKADLKCIRRYTKKLGWRVAEVYGWNISA